MDFTGVWAWGLWKMSFSFGYVGGVDLGGVLKTPLNSCGDDSAQLRIRLILVWHARFSARPLSLAQWKV